VVGAINEAVLKRWWWDEKRGEQLQAQVRAQEGEWVKQQGPGEGDSWSCQTVEGAKAVKVAMI
jgi:hypothetical protein